VHFGIGIRVLSGVWMTLETVALAVASESRAGAVMAVEPSAALAVASESRGGAVTSVMTVEPSAVLVPSTATLLKQNQF